MKGLYQKGAGGYWYYQPAKPQGLPRPKAIALGTADEITAINAVTDMQWSGELLAAETKGTLAEVLPVYYAAKAEDRKKSRLGREQILDAFKDLMGNPRLTDITRQTILDWRQKLKVTGGSLKSSKPVSKTTMTSYLITLRAFLNWCVKEKLLRKNPAGDLGKQSTVRKTRRQEFHPLAERELMLKEPCRDYIGLIEHLGFLAGLRIGEMLVINPDWIHIAPDRKSGSISVQPTMIQLKDGTTMEWRPKTERGIRIVPMHERLIEFLDGYGMRKPYLLAPDHPLFPADDMTSLRFDPKRSLAEHAKKAGAGKSNYHKLRHSFGTHLAMGGATIAEIAGLLGITLKVAEETYAGYSPSTTNRLPGI